MKPAEIELPVGVGLLHLIGDDGLPAAQVQVPQDTAPVPDLLHSLAVQVMQQPHATVLLCDGRELSYAAQRSSHRRNPPHN